MRQRVEEVWERAVYNFEKGVRQGVQGSGGLSQDLKEVREGARRAEGTWGQRGPRGEEAVPDAQEGLWGRGRAVAGAEGRGVEGGDEVREARGLPGHWYLVCALR